MMREGEGVHEANNGLKSAIPGPGGISFKIMGEKTRSGSVRTGKGEAAQQVVPRQLHAPLPQTSNNPSTAASDGTGSTSRSKSEAPLLAPTPPPKRKSVRSRARGQILAKTLPPGGFHSPPAPGTLAKGPAGTPVLPLPLPLPHSRRSSASVPRRRTLSVRSAAAAAPPPLLRAPSSEALLEGQEQRGAPAPGDSSRRPHPAAGACPGDLLPGENTQAPPLEAEAEAAAAAAAAAAAVAAAGALKGKRPSLLSISSSFFGSAEGAGEPGPPTEFPGVGQGRTPAPSEGLMPELGLPTALQGTQKSSRRNSGKDKKVPRRRSSLKIETKVDPLDRSISRSENKDADLDKSGTKSLSTNGAIQEGKTPSSMASAFATFSKKLNPFLGTGGNAKSKWDTDMQDFIERYKVVQGMGGGGAAAAADDELFRRDNGYLWDFALVFPRENDENALMAALDKFADLGKLAEQKTLGALGASASTSRSGSGWGLNRASSARGSNSKPEVVTIKDVVRKLHEVGFETHSYLSVQEDEVIVMLRLPLTVLFQYAEKAGHCLPLDEERLEQACHARHLIIPHKPLITRRRPYEGHHAPFSRDLQNKDLFIRARGLDHPFSNINRVKLMVDIIEDKDMCDIDVESLLDTKALLGFFPLHDLEHKEQIKAIWMPPLFGPHSQMSSWRWFVRPKRHFQALAELKEYIGEKEGLYFGFLCHYSHWLTFLAFVGTCVVVESFVEGTVESWTAPYFCFFSAFWGSLMLQQWRAREAKLQLEWGMAGFQRHERDRVHFQGELTASHVHGRPVLYYPAHRRYRSVLRSNLLMGGLVLVVVGVVASLRLLKVILARFEGVYGAVGGYSANILNSVRIQLMNLVYTRVAIAFTEKENHQTDSQFENSLISKMILFQAVNSYSTFYYISFMKSHIEGCEFDSCMTDLCVSLGIIFTMEVAGNMATDIILPHYKAKWRRKQETEGTHGLELTPIEEEYVLMPYNRRMHNLRDFAKLVIQYGYVTMFVTAFPAAPVMAWVANLIKIRMDGNKLLYLHQRVLPQGKEDIGIWKDVLAAFSQVAVVTNAALVSFTLNRYALAASSHESTTGDFDDQELTTWSPSRIWYFILFQYLVFSVLWLLGKLAPDVPEAISIQLERSEHILATVLFDHDPGDHGLRRRRSSILSSCSRNALDQGDDNNEKLK